MESVLPYQCSNAPSATVIAFNRPATSKENASDFVIDDILPTVPVALFAFFLRKATPIDCLGGKTLET